MGGRVCFRVAARPRGPSSTDFPAFEPSRSFCFFLFLDFCNTCDGKTLGTLVPSVWLPSPAGTTLLSLFFFFFFFFFFLLFEAKDSWSLEAVALDGSELLHLCFFFNFPFRASQLLDPPPPPGARFRFGFPIEDTSRVSSFATVNASAASPALPGAFSLKSGFVQVSRFPRHRCAY